jgi:hypothetical protein
MPEPFDYDKNERTLQLRILSSIQNDKHYLCHQPGRERQHQWQRQKLVESSLCRLLQVPHQR